MHTLALERIGVRKMESLNVPIMTLVAVIIVGIIALTALIRRPATDEMAMKKQNEKLTGELATMEGDLRSALSRADRSEGLAEERKFEIDRLNGDLSKLRLRIDTGQMEQQILKAAISGLEAKAKGDLELVANKTIETQFATEEITKLRGRLEEEQ